MNTDILRYKYHFLTFLLLFSYAYLHFQLTGSYSEIPLEKWIDGIVRLPYGQRLLVPTLARTLSHVIPLSAKEIFFILEWFFIILFFFSLSLLLQQEFPIRPAKLLSWLFILLLPLVTVVNYRLNEGGNAALFYPFDSATLFFTTFGFLLCLREKWWLFVSWVFLATLNRESAFLLILLIPALHWDEVKKNIGPIILSFLAFLLAKIGIWFLMTDAPGQWVEWIYHPKTYTRFEMNMTWLLQKQNVFLLPYCFAGLPLFWFCFYDFIPERYKPLRYVALFYFLALLCVGNIMEARIYGEIIVLLYLPVCVGMSRWLSKESISRPKERKFMGWLNRYSVILILLFTVIFQRYYNTVIIWLSQTH